MKTMDKGQDYLMSNATRAAHSVYWRKDCDSKVDRMRSRRQRTDREKDTRS